MKSIKISDKKIYLEYHTRKEMNLSFFRLSEFFEGDKVLKGKYFTPDMFIERWTDKDGEWKKMGKGETYFNFWDGYNISVKSLFDFSKLFSISHREQNIIEAICKNNIASDGYIIVGIKGDKVTLKHELAHGLYFDNKEYKKEAIEIVKTLPEKTLEKYIRHLKEMNYIYPFEDEIHAYLTAYDSSEYKEIFSTIKISEIRKQRDLLNKLYKKYK